MGLSSARVAAVWYALQVDVQGHYSVRNLHEFVAYYEQTSWKRVLLVCLLTPVPCIVFVILLDLIPLDAPSHGPHSIRMWVRVFIVLVAITLCMLQQCRSHLAWLKLTIRYIVALAVLSGSLATIWCYGLALQIGYPLPFLLHLSGAPIILVFGVGIYAYYRRVPHRPVSARRLLRYMSIFTCQYFMILVYPLFNHVFSRLSASQQTPAVLILPAIKTICKHWINYALPDNETTKAEAIILNVEVFHALFVAFCMQSATSKRTVVALIVVDVGQALLSFVDIRNTLRLLKQSRGIPLDCTTFPHLLQEVVTANPVDNVSSPAHNGQIVPASSRRNARRTNVDPSILGAALQLLYVTEFIVLVEYTEVIMPLVYSIYVVTLSQLSNHEYYQFLQSMTRSDVTALLTNVVVYASLELISLVLFALVVWWHLRLSVLHQLAFVLETHKLTVQAKLVPWTLFVVNNALLHCGADYSFQFQWIHARSTSTETE